MAKHEVTMNINDKIVLHRDVDIEIKSGGRKLGTILISKGNIEWLPAGHSVNKFRLSWKDFAELIASNGKAVKVSGKATKKSAKPAKSPLAAAAQD